MNTSYLDLKSIIEQVAGMSLRGPNGTGEKRSYNGPCPLCKLGTDRFAVFMDCEYPHFHCGVHGNGCGAHGDAIEFVRLYNQCSYTEACEYLHEHYGLSLDGVSLPRPPRVQETRFDIAPCEAWQKRAIALVKEAMDFLWDDTNEVARRALAYLRKRGLTDDTIKHAKLGYIVAERYDLRADWGLKDIDNGKDKKPTTKLFIPRGWLIPWLIDKSLWRVDIRRHPVDIKVSEEAAQKDDRKKPIGKYHRLSGSSNGVYGVNRIKPGQPLFVVESPVDALTGQQEAPEYAWAATGSTVGARSDPRWSEAMSVASPVLFPFDADGAGSQAFEHWKPTACKPFRWLPLAHDVNEMKQQGMDIKVWAEDGVETALLFAGESVTEKDVTKNVTETFVTPEQETIPDDDYCLACGTLLSGPDWLVTLDGDAAFCGPCWEKHHITLESTNLRARVAAWLEGAGCACCGGHDWLVDHDGLLISPCLVKKRQIGAIRDQEIEMERKREWQKWDAYAA